MNKWIRQAHRWLSIAFTVVVIVNGVAVAEGKYTNKLGLLAVGTGVEFGGDHCGQNSALEDPSIFAEPEVFFSPAKPDVNARVEQKQSDRQ